MENKITIRTSEENWLSKLTGAYKDKNSVILIDDAKIGIDPTFDSIFDMGTKSKLTQREWIGIGYSVGLTAVGIGIILIAAFDPEPTSKLATLLIGGVALTLMGAGSGIYIITRLKPPKVTINKDGSFTIEWN